MPPAPLTPLRLAFMGSDPIALPLLEWLASPAGASQAAIVAIYTQPDRPSGRGQKIQPNAIKLWALARGIPVLQPEKLTDATRAELAALAPDLTLVMACGHILRDEFIATPRLGTLNLHTSLLPKYRGASPIQTAIACGETETGVSLMRIVRRLDAGPVADVERVSIAPLDTALDVEKKLAAACVPLIARALPKLAAGALVFTPQDDARATHCRCLEKNDGALDFNAPAAVLAARINGLSPWPACCVEIAGQAVKFGLADYVARAASPCGSSDTGCQPVGSSDTGDSPVQHGLAARATCVSATGTGDSPVPHDPSPGTVLAGDNRTLDIATGDGVLRVHRLQRPCCKMLPAADFLRGFPIPAGTQLVSQPMPALLTTLTHKPISTKP